MSVPLAAPHAGTRSPPKSSLRRGSSGAGNASGTSGSAYPGNSGADRRSLGPKTLTLQDLHQEARYLAQRQPEQQQLKRQRERQETTLKPSTASPGGIAAASAQASASVWSFASSLTSTAGSDKSWTSTLYSVGDLLKGYVPATIPFLSTSTDTRSADSPSRFTGSQDNMGRKQGYWGRTADEIVTESGGQVPKIFSDLRDVILGQCVTTEGIFRRSSNSAVLPAIIATLDMPVDDQPTLPWSDVARDDPLLPPKILLRLCSQMAEPLVPQSLYASVRQATDADSLRTVFLPALSDSARLILGHLTETLHAVAKHEPTTRMSSLALAIVVAPTLIAGSDPLEDAALCLAPGKQLPAGMTAGNTGADAMCRAGNTLVGVLALWIEHWPELQGRKGSKCEA